MNGHRAICAALAVLSGCGLGDLEPDWKIGLIEGLAVGAEPIRGATVEIWKVNGRGEKTGSPLYSAQSDEEGRFRIEVPALKPPFLVTARGGVTTEHWADEDVALDDGIHVQTVVTKDCPGDTHPLVLSPLTTVAKALGDQRFRLDGSEGSVAYANTVEDAYKRLGSHFEVELRRTFPARVMDASVTEGVRYALVLDGLSSIVHDLARQSSRSIQAIHILTLTTALVEDAMGPEARMDGVGPAGPVALGVCGERCMLPPTAFRGALVAAVIRDFLSSLVDETALDFGDVGEYLQRLASRLDPALFGDVAPDALDTSPPAIEMLPSPIYDESRDRIAFDDGKTPSHVHDTLATIDLAQGFGDTCPVVYKHADLSRSFDSNPLRWTVAVRDDLVGVSPMDVRASIRPMGSTAPAIELVPSPAQAIAGGFTFDVTATGAELAALAASEGMYEVELQVKDWLGNAAAPLVGCWQQVTLAAPLWAGSFDVALGPGSFDETRLENDNLAPVLRGEETPVLARLEIENNTDEDVYLTLSIDELVGRYSATWTSSRALLYSENGLNDCLGTGACTTAPPPDPVSEIVPPQALPASLVALRVVDLSTGLEADCMGCRQDEVRIARRGRYEVQVVAADLGFLVSADVDRARIAEIGVGPIGNAARLTGVDGGVYVHCTKDEGGGTCSVRKGYQLYQVITDAVIQIDALVVSAMVSPSPALAPRRPLPPAEAAVSTLSAPVSTAVTWTTLDESLPNPG